MARDMARAQRLALDSDPVWKAIQEEHRRSMLMIPQRKQA